MIKINKLEKMGNFMSAAYEAVNYFKKPSPIISVISKTKTEDPLQIVRENDINIDIAEINEKINTIHDKNKKSERIKYNQKTKKSRFIIKEKFIGEQNQFAILTRIRLIKSRKCRTRPVDTSLAIPFKKGFGKVGAKRLQKSKKNVFLGFTRTAIKRLARRAGVERFSRLVYSETRNDLRTYLEHIVRDAVTIANYTRKKTVGAMEVVYALRRQPTTWVGF